MFRGRSFQGRNPAARKEPESGLTASGNGREYLTPLRSCVFLTMRAQGSGIPQEPSTPDRRTEEVTGMVLSYRWRRNPVHLLQAWGMGDRARTAQEEKIFMERLEAAPKDVPGDLCLVMGGFTDAVFGRAYRILEELPALLGSGFDLYYREYDEISAARRLLRCYGGLSRRVVLIGHSWGGSSLARDVVYACPEVRVNVLITLDPVGLRSPRFLPQVRRWLNVYLPYDRAAWSRENNIARLGRPWEYVRQAGVNRVPSQLRHADALGMFREFGEGFIRLALLDE